MSTTNARTEITDTTARSVFISYSGNEALQAAHQLAGTLRAAAFDVWVSAPQLDGGTSWNRDVENALNKCDVLIALLSEESFASVTCRAQQMWFVQAGKQVVPLLVTPGAPRPPHLSTHTVLTYPIEERQLLAAIRAAPSAQLRSSAILRLTNTPSLPENFMPRAAVAAALRELVFSSGEGTNHALTAVVGMGGVGKTVLASEFCRSTAAQRAFPDGIAWITLGREWDGDAVRCMRQVCRELSENPQPDCDEKGESARAAYRAIVAEKAVLIVIDDVWKVEDLRPFLVDAARSRLLFTTRDAVIAQAVNARTFAAAVLERHEALALLARSAQISIAELPLEADDIAGACNGLSLAIAQIGGSLRLLPVSAWRKTVAALKSVHIGKIEKQLPSGQESFFRSLAVSIESAPPDMRERYLRLAFLLEDVLAPLPVLQALWMADETDTHRTARFFVEKSLATWEAASDLARGIKLHDLQLDYVRACYPHREALELIHGAVRLSGHVIRDDPFQFASQVTGRLLPYHDFPGTDLFLGELLAGAPKPWLRPLHSNLHPAGTPLLRTLEGQSEMVRCVAVTADGKRAVSAAYDATLKVWNVENGTLIRTLEGHSDWVLSLALSADGRRAVSGSADMTLKVWDVESGRLLNTLKGHSKSVWGVALTVNGKLAVSASQDNTLKIWDIDRGRLQQTLQGHTLWVKAVALTGDGKRAVSASMDRTLRVWDLQNGQALHTLQGHAGAVNDVALTADGTRAVSGSSDGTLKIWDLASGRQLQTLDADCSALGRGLALTADGKRAVSASKKNTLKVFDLESGKTLRTLAGHSDYVTSVAVAGEKLALSASADGTVKVWDLEGGGAVRTRLGHSPRAVKSITLTADGTRAVSVDSHDELKVWDVSSGRELQTLGGRSSSVVGVLLAVDGRYSARAKRDTELELEEHRENDRTVNELCGQSDWVRGLLVTVDGKRALAASSDSGTLTAWDLKCPTRPRELQSPSVNVERVALTLDGKRGVAVLENHTLRVWDLKSGSTLCRLVGHSADVTGVTLTGDGKRLASVSEDRTLRVWDLERAISIAAFHADTGLLCCALVGQIIAAGDEEGRVHFLRIEE